jgi:hypothetical protein
MAKAIEFNQSNTTNTPASLDAITRSRAKSLLVLVANLGTDFALK